MNPKLNTSLRGRGKWGDFLISFIPLSWCVNILLNSNFILRMIEWQNESSLFTIRIHGKQWYWVYKFELRDMIDIWTAPRNVGRNRWAFIDGNELSVSDFYVQAIQARTRSTWLKEYWPEIVKKDIKPDQSADISGNADTTEEPNLVQFSTEGLLSLDKGITLQEQVSGGLNKAIIELSTQQDTTPVWLEPMLSGGDEGVNTIDSDAQTVVGVKKRKKLKELSVESSAWLYEALRTQPAAPNKSIFFKSIQPSSTLHYDCVPLDDQWDIEHNIRKLKPVGPFRIVKYILTPEYLKSSADLFKVRFYDDSAMAVKAEDNSENFWVLKQKRYKKKQSIAESQYTVTDFYDMKVYTKNDNVPKFDAARVLLNSTIFETMDNFVVRPEPKIVAKPSSDVPETTPAFDLYFCVRNNKKRGELLPITLSRRLLRTKRTLVLPAHVNMTIVTNSYDVVHSWFIPGLGIKLDCVPGRATHHSLYIDNIGFYYGQCAEICGRYHHHMPIRICALPFEHFLVWWRVKGLPKLLKIKLTDPMLHKDRIKNTYYEHELLGYSNLKYYW